MIGNVNSKTKEDLLEEFAKRTDHNTLAGEQYTAAIIVKSSSDIQVAANAIKESVDNFKDVAKKMGESSDKLAKKLLWLNIILAAATLVGAIATAVLVFK